MRLSGSPTQLNKEAAHAESAASRLFGLGLTSEIPAPGLLDGHSKRVVGGRVSNYIDVIVPVDGNYAVPTLAVVRFSTKISGVAIEETGRFTNRKLSPIVTLRTPRDLDRQGLAIANPNDITIVRFATDETFNARVTS